MSEDSKGWRMDAYYYGFTDTGDTPIDKILSAVACAGKAFHYTQQWIEDTTPYDHLRGETCEDWIQNAANDAAAEIAALRADAALGANFRKLVATGWDVTAVRYVWIPDGTIHFDVSADDGNQETSRYPVDVTGDTLDAAIADAVAEWERGEQP